MHPYATQGSRVSIYSAMGVISVILAWVAAWITSPWELQWLVSAPSFGGVFALLYTAFDRRLWRHPIVHHLGIVDVQDVSGTYDGHLISSFKREDGKRVRLGVTFQIKQTWTHIEVLMTVKGGSSSSKSQSAAASACVRGQGVRLRYIFENRVNPAIADDDMHDHEGTADLDISSTGTIEGRYYNARARTGSIRAKRLPGDSA